MMRLGAIPRNKLKAALAIVLAGLVVVGAAVAIRNTFFRPTTITAYFPTATAIYPGDDVRVSGMKIGTIAIHPTAGHPGEDSDARRSQCAHSGRCESGYRRPEPGGGALRPAHPGLPFEWPHHA